MQTRTGAEVEAPQDSPESAPLLADRAALLRRLHLVQGQIAGLIRMAGAGRASSDIIIQLSAATHALHRVGFLLVAEEMCNSDLADVSEGAAARRAALEKLFMSLA